MTDRPVADQRHAAAVLRMDDDSVLLYADPTSRSLLRDLGLGVGGRIPSESLGPPTHTRFLHGRTVVASVVPR